MISRLGVLVSGRGSNLAAILRSRAEAPGLPELVVVASNVPGCAALAQAAEAGIPTVALDPREQPSREAFDAALAEVLVEARVDLVCLAGYLRLLGRPILEAFTGRIVNVHPSLLPAFPGLHAQRQAIAAGVRVSGCTVHFVDAGLDTGPILAQAAVPVLPEDTEAALSARILEQEHRLYPAAIRWLTSGQAILEGGRVRWRGAPQSQGAISSPWLGAPEEGGFADRRVEAVRPEHSKEEGGFADRRVEAVRPEPSS